MMAIPFMYVLLLILIMALCKMFSELIIIISYPGIDYLCALHTDHCIVYSYENCKNSIGRLETWPCACALVNSESLHTT